MAELEKPPGQIAEEIKVCEGLIPQFKGIGTNDVSITVEDARDPQKAQKFIEANVAKTWAMARAMPQTAEWYLDKTLILKGVLDGMYRRMQLLEPQLQDTSVSPQPTDALVSTSRTFLKIPTTKGYLSLWSPRGVLHPDLRESVAKAVDTKWGKDTFHLTRSFTIAEVVTNHLVYGSSMIPKDFRDSETVADGVVNLMQLVEDFATKRLTVPHNSFFISRDTRARAVEQTLQFIIANQLFALLGENQESLKSRILRLNLPLQALVERVGEDGFTQVSAGLDNLPNVHGALFSVGLSR